MNQDSALASCVRELLSNHNERSPASLQQPQHLPTTHQKDLTLALHRLDEMYEATGAVV